MSPPRPRGRLVLLVVAVLVVLVEVVVVLEDLVVVVGLAYRDGVVVGAAQAADSVHGSGGMRSTCPG